MKIIPSSSLERFRTLLRRWRVKKEKEERKRRGKIGIGFDRGFKIDWTPWAGNNRFGKQIFFSAKCIRRVVCPEDKNNKGRIFFGWDACHNASRQDNRQCFRIFDSDVGYTAPPISIFYKITIRLVSPTTGLFGQLFVVRTWFLRNNLVYRQPLSLLLFH